MRGGPLARRGCAWGRAATKLGFWWVPRAGGLVTAQPLAVRLQVGAPRARGAPWRLGLSLGARGRGGSGRGGREWGRGAARGAHHRHNSLRRKGCCGARGRSGALLGRGRGGGERGRLSVGRWGGAAAAMPRGARGSGRRRGRRAAEAKGCACPAPRWPLRAEAAAGMAPCGPFRGYGARGTAAVALAAAATRASGAGSQSREMP